MKVQADGINRPATHTDFKSVYTFFFTLRIWQNTDFLS